MLHKINGYYFDSDRLLFINDNYSKEIIEDIQSSVKIVCSYNEIKAKLDNYNPNRIHINTGAVKNAGICLTKNCNLRCTYCSDNSKDGNVDNLTLDSVLIFVSDVMKRWVLNKFITHTEEPLGIYFTGGGEPTYDWELFVSVINGIKEKADYNTIPIKLFITSNGVLNQVQREFISKNFDTILISYDGLGEIQNRNRRAADNQDTANVVEDTIKYFSKKGNHLLKIRTTIWPDDFKLLKKMADNIFSSFGTELEWSILPVFPRGRAVSKFNEQISKDLNPDFLTNYLRLLEYVKLKYGKCIISSPLFSGSLTTNIYCGGMSINCSTLWLLPNGEIVTCMESSNDRTILGHVDNHNVTYFTSCRDPLLEIYKKMFSKCRDCIAYSFCKGGCPVKHQSNQYTKIKSGEINWECQQLIAYWKYIFSRIISGEKCFGYGVKILKTGKNDEYEVLQMVKINDS